MTSGLTRSAAFRELGLPPTASEAEIRREHRRLSLVHHPDKNPSANEAESAAHTAKISSINNARDKLMEPEEEDDDHHCHHGHGFGRGSPADGFYDEDDIRDDIFGSFDFFAHLFGGGFARSGPSGFHFSYGGSPPHQTKRPQGQAPRHDFEKEYEFTGSYRAPQIHDDWEDDVEEFEYMKMNFMARCDDVVISTIRGGGSRAQVEKLMRGSGSSRSVGRKYEAFGWAAAVDQYKNTPMHYVAAYRKERLLEELKVRNGGRFDESIFVALAAENHMQRIPSNVNPRSEGKFQQRFDCFTKLAEDTLAAAERRRVSNRKKKEKKKEKKREKREKNEAVAAEAARKAQEEEAENEARMTAEALQELEKAERARNAAVEADMLERERVAAKAAEMDQLAEEARRRQELLRNRTFDAPEDYEAAGPSANVQEKECKTPVETRDEAEARKAEKAEERRIVAKEKERVAQLRRQAVERRAEENFRKKHEAAEELNRKLARDLAADAEAQVRADAKAKANEAKAKTRLDAIARARVADQGTATSETRGPSKKKSKKKKKVTASASASDPVLVQSSSISPVPTSAVPPSRACELASSVTACVPFSSQMESNIPPSHFTSLTAHNSSSSEEYEAVFLTSVSEQTFDQVHWSLEDFESEYVKQVGVKCVTLECDFFGSDRTDLLCSGCFASSNRISGSVAARRTAEQAQKPTSPKPKDEVSDWAPESPFWQPSGRTEDSSVGTSLPLPNFGEGPLANAPRSPAAYTKSSDHSRGSLTYNGFFKPVYKDLVDGTALAPVAAVPETTAPVTATPVMAASVARAVRQGASHSSGDNTRVPGSSKRINHTKPVQDAPTSSSKPPASSSSQSQTENLESSSSALKLKKQKPCRYFFLTGKCRYGDKCRYPHMNPPSPTEAAEGTKRVEEPSVGSTTADSPTAAPESAPVTSRGNRKVNQTVRPCRSYAQDGTCRLGAKCWFRHDQAAPASDATAGTAPSSTAKSSSADILQPQTGKGHSVVRQKRKAQQQKKAKKAAHKKTTQDSDAQSGA